MVQNNSQSKAIIQNNSPGKIRMSSVTHPLKHFLERIMPDALEKHNGKVSVGGRNITNLRFANEKMLWGRAGTRSRS